MHYSDKNENSREIEKQSKEQVDTLCKKENIFAMDEIQIEEMAIDGICGVY